MKLSRRSSSDRPPSPLPPSPRLPFEILTAIFCEAMLDPVEEFFDDDGEYEDDIYHQVPGLLYEYALVSRQWCSAAQPLLYRAVNFSADIDSDALVIVDEDRREAHALTITPGKLIKTLVDFPHIRCLVKQVKLAYPCRSYYNSLTEKKEQHDVSMTRVFPEFTSYILVMCREVKSLVVDGIPDEPALGSLVDVLRDPGKVERGMLRELALRMSSYYPHDVDFGKVVQMLQEQHNLNYFETHGISFHRRSKFTPNLLPQCKRLTIHERPGYYILPMFELVTANSSNSLTSLYLSLISAIFPINFSNFPNLTTLGWSADVDGIFLDDEDEPYCDNDFETKCFSNLSTLQHLTNLEIDWMATSPLHANLFSTWIFSQIPSKLLRLSTRSPDFSLFVAFLNSPRGSSLRKLEIFYFGKRYPSKYNNSPHDWSKDWNTWNPWSFILLGNLVKGRHLRMQFSERVWLEKFGESLFDGYF